MSSSGQSTPATFWRAFFVSCVVAASAAAAVPRGPLPELSQIGAPDAEKAREILEEFRQSGIPGSYFLEFELQSIPRSGPATIYRGRYWGGRNEQGAISRVELSDAAGKTHRLLVQNGEKARVWRLVDGKVQPVDDASSFEPLLPGVHVSAFDLQMPFLYWPDATYEKLTRGYRGRPTHTYIFRAPPTFDAGKSGVTAVRAYLDTQFNALMQTELLGPDRVLKTMALGELKKVPGTEQWVPKTFDFRDEEARDQGDRKAGYKTRFVITAVALEMEFPPALWEPAALTENVSPPRGRLVRLEP